MSGEILNDARRDIEEIRKRERRRSHHDREMARFFKVQWFDTYAEQVITELERATGGDTP